MTKTTLLKCKLSSFSFTSFIPTSSSLVFLCSSVLLSSTKSFAFLLTVCCILDGITHSLCVNQRRSTCSSSDSMCVLFFSFLHFLSPIFIVTFPIYLSIYFFIWSYILFSISFMCLCVHLLGQSQGRSDGC